MLLTCRSRQPSSGFASNVKAAIPAARGADADVLKMVKISIFRIEGKDTRCVTLYKNDASRWSQSFFPQLPHLEQKNNLVLTARSKIKDLAC